MAMAARDAFSALREIELRGVHRDQAVIGPEPVLGRTVRDEVLLSCYPFVDAAPR